MMTPKGSDYRFTKPIPVANVECRADIVEFIHIMGEAGMVLFIQE